VTYAHADREAVLNEFADFVVGFIIDADKPVLVTAEQLRRWGRAFQVDVFGADSHRADHLLANIHARLTAIFELAATDGGTPDSVWISIDRSSRSFAITEAHADTEAVSA